MTTNRIQAACLRWGGFAVIATCFCIPLSTSLMELSSVLVVLCWLGSGRAAVMLGLVRYHLVAALAALLFLYFVVAIGYSPAEPGEAFAVLMKYRELLLLPLVLSLAVGDQTLVRRAENGFVAGAVVLMLVSYAMSLGLLPAAKYGNSLLFHITHSFFMALLGYWALQRAIDRPRRLLWALVFALATANIIFIAPGRTGLFTYAVLLGFAALQRLGLKQRLAAGLVLILLLPAGFMVSTNISSRVQQALQDIIHYEPGISRSSLGMRLDWWGNSIELIKERPLFGHGTGSFAVRQQQLIAGGATMPSDNPHNEYLFIGVQLGLTGLALFLALLASQWFAAARLDRHSRFLLQGLVLTMATGCLMNSFLFDSHQGHFYAFLSALLLSHPREQRSPTT